VRRIDPSTIVLKPVKVTFFEMRNRPEEEFHEKHEAHFRALQKPIDVETYRYYYSAVGMQYSWLDRLVMDDDPLFELINGPKTDIFVMSINDQPAGYVEFIIEKNLLRYFILE